MTHATPTELIARAMLLEDDAKWAVGHDRAELLACARVLRQLASEALEAANDNEPKTETKAGAVA